MDLFYRTVIVPVSGVEAENPYQHPIETAEKIGKMDGTVGGVDGKDVSYTSCVRTECPLFVQYQQK